MSRKDSVKDSSYILYTGFNRIVQALYHCRQIQAFKYGKSLHCLIVKSGFSRNVYLGNNLISIYSNCLSLDDAHQVFDEMPEKNVVSWTSLISAYTRSGDHNEALRIFSHMPELGLEVPNSFTLSAALKACTFSQNLERGKSIHDCIVARKLQKDTVLMNSLLDMYVKCGSLTMAREVFDGIVSKNSISWNSIIDGYSKEGQMEEALNLFYQMPKHDTVTWTSVIAGFARREDPQALKFVCMMHREGHKLDDFTFPCVMKACGCMRDIMMGKQIHGYMVKFASLSSCFVGSALVDMYSKCRVVVEAIKVFNEYESRKESIHGRMSLWNSMISGFAINDHNTAAFDLVSRAHKFNLPLDSYTFGSVLKVCIDSFDLKVGSQVHGLIVISGYQLDSIVGSALTDLYAKSGNTVAALWIFTRLPAKDLVAWAGLISACAQQGLNSFAFSLFRRMIYSNLEVDEFVVSSVLNACSSVTGLERGRQVHAYCSKSGYESEGVTVTSLIDMYSKCGEIEDALQLFKDAEERDTICWTSIIVGCGQNGRVLEGIRYFKDMLRMGIKPNEITFLAVLSACRHAGFVQEACEIFTSMRMEHQLIPKIEHYCCMVDILGRGGLFEEAERLICEMPYEPDETIWSSLLGACGIHNNVEIGKLVAERLLALYPDDASRYVTLSNVFASLGLWDESTKLREWIREVGTKEAGRSWIEIRK